MMKSHQGETALEMRLASPDFETLAGLPRKQKSSMPVLSASASKDEKKKIMTFSVVNRHLHDDLKTRIRIDGPDSIQSGKLSVLNSSGVRDVNTFERPRLVRPKRTKLDVSGRSFVHSFPAHSLSVFCFTLK